MPKQVYKMFDRKTVGQSHIYLDQLPREANGIYNMSFDTNGRLVKRTGYTKHNTTSLSADHPITGLYRFYKLDTSSKFTLAVCDTVLYKLANTDPWAGTSIKTGLTSEADMYFDSFYNRCYFCNDEDGLFKFGIDDTAVRTTGITAPAAKPTGVAQGSGGSFGAGDYKFCYTYVDEDGYESNASPVSDAITCVADDSVVLTIVNSGDTKVASRNIYRTAVGGAIYYYDGEVADNTTLTYTSTKADGTLGTQVSTKHDTAPTSPQIVVKRGNRLYLGDDDNLYISALSDVEYFPAAWFQKTTDRRKITRIIEQMSKLIVFTEDVINVLSGTNEDNFTFKKAFHGDGCIATKSIQNIKNYIIFLSFDGLMAFNGQEVVEIDEKLSKYLRDNINYAYADTSCSCYYDDKYILSYPKGSATYPTESVYFDYKTGKTGVHSFAFNVFSRWDKGSDGILIKAGSTTIGRVYNLFDSTYLDDDGLDIEFYDKIMPLDFALPEVEKNYYDIYVKVKSTTASSLTMYYTIDDNDETSNARQIDRSDITFVDNDGGADTITTTEGDFTTFVAGDILVITGTDNNNGTVTIVSVAEKVITLATDTLTTETIGDAVLTANLTLAANAERWYRVRLPSSTRGRSIAIRPRMNDKYQAEFQGYIIVYDTEALRV